MGGTTVAVFKTYLLYFHFIQGTTITDILEENMVQFPKLSETVRSIMKIDDIVSCYTFMGQ